MTAGLSETMQALRPALHRYCARLMGSVIDGEDIVQDVLVRALAQPEMEAAVLRPWLFKVAHNRALDLLRGRAIRATEPIGAADDVADGADGPVEAVMRREAVRTAVSRFIELPVMQRSVVVLKDVLDESLIDIAGLLDLSVDAVKGHLARGRARLRQINSEAKAVAARPISDSVARYVGLFNRHDWDGLRAMLADDVKLKQSDYPIRSDDVRAFFGFYAKSDDVRAAPTWLDGREVIAVYEGTGPGPSHFMWLAWDDGKISFIRDYRYVPYMAAEADLVMA